MAILSTLRTETYDILNELVTSNVYSSTYIDQLINDEHVEVCAMRKWQFLRKKFLFEAPINTTLSTALTTASTEVVCAAVTNFDSAGAIYIDQDVIDYTAISTLTLTTASNIDLSHAAGAEIRPLKSVPSDYGKQPEMSVMRTNSSSIVRFEYVNEYEYEDSTISRKFTVLVDSGGDEFILTNGLVSGDQVIFKYLKTPTTLSSDSDVSSIPDQWAIKVIPKLVAWKAMYTRNDDLEGLGSKIRMLAEMELQKMMKYYGDREHGASKIIKSAYSSNVTDILPNK